MQPNVPVATDNLHKLMATFGLAIIIASLVGIYMVYKSANEEIYLVADRMFELYKAGLHETALGKDMMSVYDKRIEIAAGNRTAYLWLLFPMFGLGWGFSIVGFERWKKIQKIQDELLELQVTKARMQVHKVNEYRELPPKPEPPKKKWEWPWKPKPETKNPA